MVNRKGLNSQDKMIVDYFVALKHRLENDKGLLINAPQGTAIALSRSDKQILATYMDRKTIQKMPCPARLIKQACEMLNSVAELGRSSSLKYTLLVVYDSALDLTALIQVVWDDGDKIAMSVFLDDEMFMLDERC